MSRNADGHPESGKTETATGWTRVLYFRDPRPPVLIVGALERELMVLFRPSREGSQWKWEAAAHVNGARYQFELLFLAAQKYDLCYSLRTEASWADTQTAHHEYHRKASESWYSLWTRDLVSAKPPAPAENLIELYRQQGEEALQAQRHLASVAAVQQMIVEGLKRGGTYSKSHKEGGTHIGWRQGKFVRSDYGDYPGQSEFPDEAAFLKMLWEFCRFDVVQHAGPEGLSELDAWKLILRRMNQASPATEKRRGGGSQLASAALVPPVLGVGAMAPLYSSPLAKILLVGVLVAIGVALAAWQFVSIKSTGVPLGPAMRTPTHVFQLISTVERYLPSLHRAPGKDRFRIDLLVVPTANPEQLKVFTLIRQQQANALTPMTRILGVEGEVVWVQALDLFAVNFQTGRILRSADLKRLNPELELFLNSARTEFNEQLVAVSPDWSKAYAFPVDTFKANACPPPPRGSWVDEQGNGRIEISLCSGGWIATNAWIAVATAEEAESDWRPRYSMPREFNAGEKDRLRTLYGGTADAREARPPILTRQRLSATEYRQANFLRSQPRGKILRVQNPDSVFLLSRLGTELFAPYTLTRLSPTGEAIWKATTGIGRLEQVLPGTEVIALIGERPPIPNKVPEPILVLVNVATGSTNSVSLWRK
ncbi:MAG: hypothetical protein J0M24_19110 [Verrucomicrobia bacterium]|nr:hypothetical protein [Verrucomicrobiota bacterium]